MGVLHRCTKRWLRDKSSSRDHSWPETGLAKRNSSGIGWGSVGTYWAWALAWSALDFAQVLDTVLDADARHKVVEGVAGVVCRIVLAGRVTGAVRDSGAV